MIWTLYKEGKLTSNNLILTLSIPNNLRLDEDWCNKTNGFNAIIFVSHEGRFETVKYLQTDISIS